jgi:hypothetical protein
VPLFFGPSIPFASPAKSEYFPLTPSNLIIETSPPLISQLQVPGGNPSRTKWHPILPFSPFFLKDDGNGPQCQSSSLLSFSGFLMVRSAKNTGFSLKTAA